MAKNLKIKIKNTQLNKLKAKLAGKQEEKNKTQPKAKAKPKTKPKPKGKVAPKAEEVVEEKPKPRRIRAKSKSAFAPKEAEAIAPEEKLEELPPSPAVEEELSPLEEIASPAEPEEVEAKEEAIEAPVLEETPAEKPEKKREAKAPKKETLGPTGRHIKDLLPKKPEAPKKERAAAPPSEKEAPAAKKEMRKGKKVRDFKDLKPARRGQAMRAFDARDRKGLRESDDDRWRKKRPSKQDRGLRDEIPAVRPSALTVRLPITIKDLAVEMKLKASELIQKLFLGGMAYTLNDLLDDETIVQYIGNEFGCEISVDTSEEERIQITSESVQEEIRATDPEKLHIRPPVVAFMGHVDHGKTSLIDAIRKSNIVSGEAGAITQHIGAFRCKTSVGNLTILDTPGHEAFSAMRARGAEVTDIVVLVIAGDEGLRDQTLEAIQHAKAAGVTIVVALNKCDKPNFNADNVYRELSEVELLPESWGGQTITVNTSAITGEGIDTLLEMLALQAEVLEIRANPDARARGIVLESELHKGLGSVATVLVQNGTLHHGDAVVFEQHWGRIKTMHDEHGAQLQEAGPSTPVEITGLSGLPAAGDPFIIVKSEKEAREITEARQVGREQRALQQRKLPTLDKLLQEGAGEKKVLKLIIRADVQGSAEALRTSILKIESEKAEADVIFMGVGEISESDIQLAAASKAVIIGFHTAIEAHADPLIKELSVTVRLFDVIYHAIDEVKAMMLGLLDKIAEEHETGRAEVQAIFKASQLGVIAGCLVSDGIISRNHRIRVMREEEEIWRGGIASIKRVKEDVKEIKKGFECGILLDGFNALQEGDILVAYEIVYKTQEL